MIRMALCDDERSILDEVSQHIEQYADKRACGGIETVCFESVNALLSALEDGHVFDVFLLDVYVGDGMGTELAKSIRRLGIDSPILFLTSSVEHAPESFETGTLRYLLKPLDPAKLYEALDAAVAKFERQQARQIKLKTESGVESINASRILFSEAHDHYQFVTLVDGRQLKVRMTVAELYGILAKHDGFVRVGSAYVINLRNVKTVTTASVSLYNGFSIPIPRGKHTAIKNAFWDYQSEKEEE